jgi:hypothetical protein
MSKPDLSEWDWRIFVYNGSTFIEWTDPEGRKYMEIVTRPFGPRRARRYVSRFAATRKAKGVA